MSLDVYLSKVMETEIYSANITHNLNTMADAAGIYKALWRPEELFTKPKAHQLVPLLAEGLAKLKADPDYYEQFEPENGWGTYEGFVSFVENYLEACKGEPDADVRAWR